MENLIKNIQDLIQAKMAMENYTSNDLPVLVDDLEDFFADKKTFRISDIVKYFFDGKRFDKKIPPYTPEWLAENLVRLHKTKRITIVEDNITIN